MRKICFVILVSSLNFLASAQERFVYEGRVEFERKINLHRQIDQSEGDDWYKEFVTKAPQFHTSLFALHFKNNATLYKPAGEMPKVEFPWLLGPAKENVVKINLESGVRSSLKSVFEKKFTVNDTAGQLRWRISDEKRTIAGMECRKAVTVICDSVYVVAFYTDEIPVSSGPESFGGLPGMILGLAIPRLHTTWFATRIVLAPPTPKDLELVARAQQTDRQKLLRTLNSSFENWGVYKNRNIWWIFL